MRKGLAGLVLGLSLLVASLAWAGFTMSRTILDPGRSERLADQLFDNEQLRAALVDRVAAGLGAALPDGAPVVPDQLLEQAADKALDDPSVQAVVRDGIVRTHRNALEGNAEPVTVDASALGAAGRASLVEIRPELATVLPEVPPVAITLPTSGLARLGAIKNFVDRFTILAAATAAIGALVSLVVTSDRPSVLRRLAFWAFGTAAFWLIVGFGIPWVANRVAPASAAIVAAVIDVFFGAMIPPAVMLAVAGAVVLGVSFFWQAASARQGAAAIQPRRQKRPIEAAGPARTQNRPTGGHMSNIRGRTQDAAPRPQRSATADPTAVQARPAQSQQRQSPQRAAQRSQAQQHQPQPGARPGSQQRTQQQQRAQQQRTQQQLTQQQQVAQQQPQQRSPSTQQPAADVWSLTNPDDAVAKPKRQWIEGIGYIDAPDPASVPEPKRVVPPQGDQPSDGAP